MVRVNSWLCSSSRLTAAQRGHEGFTVLAVALARGGVSTSVFKIPEQPSIAQEKSLLLTLAERVTYVTTESWKLVAKLAQRLFTF